MIREINESRFEAVSQRRSRVLCAVAFKEGDFVREVYRERTSRGRYLVRVTAGSEVIGVYAKAL